MIDTNFNPKVLKIIGMTSSVLGVATTLVSEYVTTKSNENMIKEEVAKVIAEALKERV